MIMKKLKMSQLLYLEIIQLILGLTKDIQKKIKKMEKENMPKKLINMQKMKIHISLMPVLETLIMILSMWMVIMIILNMIMMKIRNTGSKTRTKACYNIMKNVKKNSKCILIITKDKYKHTFLKFEIKLCARNFRQILCT